MSGNFIKNVPQYSENEIDIDDSDLSESEIKKEREKTLKQIGFKINNIQDWDKISQPTKSNLLGLLYEMIINHEHTNVQIRIGEATFCCHMMVLQCYSEFFKDLTDQQIVILPPDKVTPQAFAMIYDWMISNEPFIQRQGILELFIAAQFLKIKELVDQCWTCLNDGERISEDSAFILYIEARKYDDIFIKELMLNRIGRFFLIMVATKEFLELTVHEICAILGKNTIAVHSEAETFMAAVRWLSYDWQKRCKHTLDIMNCIRFGLMLPWQLLEFKRNADAIELQRIVDYPKVQKMIEDGLAYVTTRYWYKNQEEAFIVLKRLKLDIPDDRLWLRDEIFLRDLQCPNEYTLTYKTFLEYLEMLKKKGTQFWKSFEFFDKNPNQVLKEYREGQNNVTKKNHSYNEVTESFQQKTQLQRQNYQYT